MKLVKTVLAMSIAVLLLATIFAGSASAQVSAPTPPEDDSSDGEDYETVPTATEDTDGATFGEKAGDIWAEVPDSAKDEVVYGGIAGGLCLTSVAATAGASAPACGPWAVSGWVITNAAEEQMEDPGEE